MLVLSTPEHWYASRAMLSAYHAGGFSAADIHSWLEAVLPGVPQQLPTGSSSNNQLLFSHYTNGTVMGAVYGQGQATFLW